MNAMNATKSITTATKAMKAALPIAFLLVATCAALSAQPYLPDCPDCHDEYHADPHGDPDLDLPTPWLDPPDPQPMPEWPRRWNAPLPKCRRCDQR